MSDIEYSVITSDIIKSFDCTMNHLDLTVSNLMGNSIGLKRSTNC